MFLKNEVKKIQPHDEHELHRSSEKHIDSLEPSPKLSVKLLNMPVNISYRAKNDRLGDSSNVRLRIKT